MSGGLKSFDELPGSTISPSLNNAGSVAQVTEPKAPETPIEQPAKETVEAPKPAADTVKKSDDGAIYVNGVKIPEIETMKPEESAAIDQPTPEATQATQSLVVKEKHNG